MIPSSQIPTGEVAARRRRTMAGYAFAVLGTATATVLTVRLFGLFERTIFAAYIVSVALIAWYGGYRPALFATALSIIAAAHWLIEPRGAWELASAQAATPLVVFAFIGGLIAWLSHVARGTEHELRRKTADLEHQATELERQIESATKLQLEVERNREFIEQAQRAAHLGSWEWDVDAGDVIWSEEMFRVYGMEPRGERVTFAEFAQYIHPDDRDGVLHLVRTASETGEPFAFEHRIIRPDGSIRWVESRGKVLPAADGRPRRMLGSGQDVTERRRAAEAQRILSEASEMLASSLDYNTTLTSVANMAVREIADWCSIAIGDSSGRYENIAVAHRDPERAKWAIEYNKANPPRFDAPTGVPNVLRTGKAEFYPDITREMLLTSAQTETQRRVIEELQIRSAMVVPLIARGRTLGAISFIAAESRHRFTQDDLWLAERLANRAAIAVDNARLYQEARAARLLAEDANRAKMDFLAAMSHELRTPLNAIAGYAQLLEMGLHGPITSEQMETLARLQRSQRHLLALVEQVLGFARIEAGKIPLELSAVLVREALASAMELVVPQLQTKRLEYHFEPCDPETRVRADRERLEQIVVNLLSNAVKFTAEGGRVTLSCRREGPAVLIAVADTGVGIPADKLDAVFEAFVQLPQAQEKRSSGVGLGLAISRDLARVMDGDVTVTSTVGAGSVFTLRLPAG